MPDDQSLHQYFLGYVAWSLQHRRIAPPEMKRNILARLQPGRAAVEPEIPLNPAFSFLHIAITALDACPAKNALILFYLTASTPLEIARRQGVCRDTIYRRIRTARRLAYRLAIRLEASVTAQTSSVVREPAGEALVAF